MAFLVQRRAGARPGAAVLSVFVAGLGVALVGGCLVETPQERDPAVQGDFDDGDPQHRPGQPCLLCHGPGHIQRPGGVKLEIAGTVYGAIDDPDEAGLEGVTVTITDATGFTFSALTNRAGNFMFQVGGSGGVRNRGDGQVDIPSEPVYPLEVEIQRGDDGQRMETRIWRNGSCAHCHGREPDVDSVGRVYLFDEVAP